MENKIDFNKLNIGDKVKYIRNKKIKILKVCEISKSYGNDFILYNYNGGFCMGKEVIKICKNKSKNK